MVRPIVKVDYPGLLNEPLPSGGERWRVRVEGDKKRRITISCGPKEEDFWRQYLAARRGEKVEPLKKASEYAKPKSISWLVNSYFEYLQERVKANTTSAKTLIEKKNLLTRLLDRPNKEMFIPQEKLIEMQDGMGATPAQADAFIEAVGVMYDWAIDRKYVKTNPARGIKGVYTKGDGATPWKTSDLKAFIAKHKPGSKAYVCLHLLVWTGCRIEDATILGRKHECVIDGIEAIRFQPSKRGSTEVCIPFVKPLKDAVRGPKVQGDTYLLGRGGRPFASGDSASAMFKRWCTQAGLGHLSAHGVRKGLGEILAELGCSQYEVMAVHGHSEAKTSEVYTRRVERWKLALGAMERVNVSHAWG